MLNKFRITPSEAQALSEMQRRCGSAADPKSRIIISRFRENPISRRHSYNSAGRRRQLERQPQREPGIGDLKMRTKSQLRHQPSMI